MSFSGVSGASKWILGFYFTLNAFPVPVYNHQQLYPGEPFLANSRSEIPFNPFRSASI